MTDIKNYYGARATERRRQFNNIINRIDMVLMNNITEVDDSVLENWQGRNPSIEIACDIVEMSESMLGDLYDGTKQYYCYEHNRATDESEECEDFGSEGPDEIYQWFAINDSDATFLQSHNQYISYSDMLDTYFLAIAHFGTGWDYVDSMVSDFDDCYVGLEDFPDSEVQA